MNTAPASSLTQQWHVVTDESDSPLLVARWFDDSARSDAAGIA